MTLQQRRDLAFLVLAGLFLGTMGMLNILGLTRFLTLGSIGGWPIVVAVGALPYPLTFLCTDLISEIWGERQASQLVWVGLLLNGWIVLILWLGGSCLGWMAMGAAQACRWRWRVSACRCSMRCDPWLSGRWGPRWWLIWPPSSRMCGCFISGSA